MKPTLGQYYRDAGLNLPAPWVDEIVLEDSPRPHQIRGLTKCAQYERYGLYYDQGTGKTLISQAWAVWNVAVGQKVVVITRPTLTTQYREEFEAWFKGIDRYLTTLVYRGTQKQRALLLEQIEREPPDILIMGYEIFRDEMFLACRRLGYTLLICDEATKCAGPDSQTHAAVHGFLGEEGEKMLLLMTGTPARTNLVNLYGYIALTYPRRYGSLAAFYAQHVDTREVKVRLPNDRSRKVEIITGYRNLDDLKAVFYARGDRVTKEECVSLPSRQLVPVKIELDPAHLRLYKRLCDERVIEVEGQVVEAQYSAKERQLKTQMLYDSTKYGLPEKKNKVFEAVQDLVEGVNPDENKVLVFAYYNRTVELLQDRFKQYKPAVVYGKSPNTDREIARFKTDPECRVMVANIESGGVGLNLQDVCAYAVFAEVTAIPGDIAQAMDRIYRMGQRRKVTVYFVIPQGTVAVDNYRTLRERLEQNNEVIGDQHTWGKSFIDQVGLEDAVDLA